MIKTKKLLFCLLLSLFLINACKKDDAEPNVPNNTVVYDGKPFEITQPGIQDLGQNTDFPSHHCYNFILTDGKLTLYDKSYIMGLQGNTFLIVANLFSPETGGFKSGTFKYINTEGLSLSEANNQVKDQFFFNIGNFSMPIYEENKDPFAMTKYERAVTTSGTIKVSGEANSYTIDIDLVMDNGKKIKGNYSGRFDLRTIELD